MQHVPTSTQADKGAGLEATLESGCVQGAGRVIAISEAALFVATSLAFSVGTRLVVGFPGPDGSTVRLAGRVSQRSTLRGRDGLGVRLFSPLPDVRERLLRDWLRAALPGDGSDTAATAPSRC